MSVVRFLAKPVPIAIAAWLAGLPLVLIYFQRALQDRAIGLFRASLCRGGVLCLGTKEDLRFSAVAEAFELVDPAAKICKKRVQP